MRNAAWRWLLWLVPLLCWAAATQAEDAAPAQKHMLWKVTAGKSVVYLFGTIHVGTADMYPLAPVIEDAFKQSSTLVEEIDLTNTGQTASAKKLLAQSAIYPSGDFLQNHLSDETRAQLKRYVAANKLDANTLVRLKPWAVTLLIAQAETVRLGLDKEKGLDRHFLQGAAQTKKPVTGLETADSQVALLSSFPDKVQEQLLLISLAEAKQSSDEMDQLLKAWKAGDPDALEAALMQPVKQYPFLKPVMAKLLDDRNDAMTQKIVGFLNLPKTYFVAVGAGHLVGERGIVSQLRAKKFTVAQL